MLASTHVLDRLDQAVCNRLKVRDLRLGLAQAVDVAKIRNARNNCSHCNVSI